MEQFQELLDYIIVVGPSLMSVLGMILSVVVSIKRQGKLNDNQISAINNLADELRQENAEVQEENARTRALIRAVITENASLKVQLNEYMKANSPIAEVRNE